MSLSSSFIIQAHHKSGADSIRVKGFVLVESLQLSLSCAAVVGIRGGGQTKAGKRTGVWGLGAV